MENSWLLPLCVFLPVVCGLAVAFIPALDKTRKARVWFVGASLLVQCVLVLAAALCTDGSFVMIWLTESMPLMLRADDVARFFSCIMTLMWTVSGFFSFEYMKHEKDERRYYAFYLLTLGVLCGLSYAGTLVTMYFFYELMTLLSIAMVLHTLSKEAIAAGIKYLLYSVAGASMGLLGIFFLVPNTTSMTFTPGGSLAAADALTLPASTLLIIVFVALVGFCTKAGMFPMHGWLPTAHPVAPAPASAVLSGVITKAGVLCVVRVIYFTVGTDFLRGTWAQYALLSFALVTVFMGSMMAFRCDHIKKRLAYSTVSQVSYILMGLFLLDKTALNGAFLHIVYHSLIKNALFLSAGAIIYKTHKTSVADLRGIGKEMPIVMWCFTIASIALIGIPPTGGFISKWNLAEGALHSAVGIFTWLGPVILLVSAILTAGYLLTVTINGFFPGNDYDYASLKKCEPNAMMTVPLIILAALAVLGGVFPGALLSFFTSIGNAVL